MFWILLSTVIFFIGAFVGYGLRSKADKKKNKMVWSRLERRNIMRTINSLVAAIDFKDHLTKSHSDNVGHYSCAIAREMQLPPEQIERIKDACQVHDLGKIGVHDSVLTKPDKLTPDEIREMRLHSLAGAVILKPFPSLDKVVEIVRQHHERYDGKGYPDGVKGEDICLGARILAVADSFDAMTSKRPYRQPKSLPEAIEELNVNSGTQFDPKIVEVFVRLIKREPGLFKGVEKIEHEPGT